jgi:hypothetical protein
MFADHGNFDAQDGAILDRVDDLQLEIGAGLIRARLGRGTPRGLGRLRRSLRFGDRDHRIVGAVTAGQRLEGGLGPGRNRLRIIAMARLRWRRHIGDSGQRLARLRSGDRLFGFAGARVGYGRAPDD